MNSLTKLLSIVKQMETQITKEICSSFYDELAILNQQHPNNASLSALFKMMQSLGKYLSARKNNAHKDAVTSLLSIANVAETIVLQPELDNKKIQIMVSRQIEHYKLLQNKLSSKPIVNPADIEDLKAVILAIDWEISDKTLDSFEDELNRQLIIFNGFNIHHTFLKIIHSTGRYVAAQKAKAHTDSIFFLRSVFKNFEQLIELPDMPFKDKKKLLEKDIKRLHDFKLKITKKPSPKLTQSHEMDDDVITPALSHIKSPSKTLTEPMEISSITALDIDDSSGDLNLQKIAPALSGKKTPGDESRDVMDDLFNIKESPADELLDAIHLLDVHGSSPDQAMSMPDSSNDLEAGIKNYTPQRIDTDPIPEIGDRLDEFFNLEPNEPQPEKTTEKPAQILDPVTISHDEQADGIITFDDENEDQTQKETFEDTSEDHTQRETLERLKSYFKSFDNIADESWYTLVQEDVSFLKDHWQKDFDKLALLDILESVLKLLNDQTMKNALAAAQTDTDSKKGFWQKIKTLFSS